MYSEGPCENERRNVLLGSAQPTALEATTSPHSSEASNERNPFADRARQLLLPACAREHLRQHLPETFGRTGIVHRPIDHRICAAPQARAAVVAGSPRARRRPQPRPAGRRWPLAQLASEHTQRVLDASRGSRDRRCMQLRSHRSTYRCGSRYRRPTSIGSTASLTPRRRAWRRARHDRNVDPQRVEEANACGDGAAMSDDLQSLRDKTPAQTDHRPERARRATAVRPARRRHVTASS